MEIITALLLGLLQGATEFLPISSSGHLVLAEEYFQVEQAGLTFDVALHMGTLLAILIYFRADITAILGALIKFQDKSPEMRNHRRIAKFICVATIPAVISGLLLKGFAESTFRNPALVASTLAGAGALLLVAEKMGKRRRNFESMTMIDAILIGFAQAFAIVPGVSRSGITMTAGLFRDLDRTAVARFSFLLSVPVIMGAGALNFVKVLRNGFEYSQGAFYAVGFFSSVLFGYVFICFLMKYIQTRSFTVFVYYRFVLAAVVVWALVL